MLNAAKPTWLVVRLVVFKKTKHMSKINLEHNKDIQGEAPSARKVEAQLAANIIPTNNTCKLR